MTAEASPLWPAKKIEASTMVATTVTA